MAADRELVLDDKPEPFDVTHGLPPFRIDCDEEYEAEPEFMTAVCDDMYEALVDNMPEQPPAIIDCDEE